MRVVHFFICINQRDSDSPLPCCGNRGGNTLLRQFQAEFARRGYPRGVKVSGSTCLTTCQQGITVVVYPDGIWYGGVTADDIPELFDAHLSGNAPVARLRVPDDVRIW